MFVRVSSFKFFFYVALDFIKFKIFDRLIPKAVFIFSRRNPSIKRGFVFFNKVGIYCYVRDGEVRNMFFMFSNFINCDIIECVIFRFSTADCYLLNCNLIFPHIDTSYVEKCSIFRGAFTESEIDSCIVKSKVYESNLIVCKIEGGYFEYNRFEYCIFNVSVDRTLNYIC